MNPSPTLVAAVPAPLSQSAATLPRIKPARANAASRLAGTLWSFLTWPFEWLLDFYGIEEMIRGSYADGYQCTNCSDMHSERKGCPKPIVTGLCLSCGRRRTLDKYGNCSFGHTDVIDRHAEHPSLKRIAGMGSHPSLMAPPTVIPQSRTSPKEVGSIE